MLPSRSAYGAAMGGDLRALPALRAEGGAWGYCADLLARLAGFDSELQSLSSFCASPEFGSPGTAEALGLATLRAVLYLDHEELARAETGLVDLGKDAELHAMRASGWREFLAGDARAGNTGAALFARASSDGDALGVVEGQILRAAGASLENDHAGALELIRKAARMAQSEHLWLSHYLASLLLCRARRLHGQTHLAARIAEACLGATGPDWHGWLQWERVFAGSSGATDAGRISIGNAIASDAFGVEAWLLGRRDRPGLTPSVTRSAPHRLDFAACARAMSTDLDDGDDDVGRWIRGQDAAIPARIAGAAALRRDSEEAGAFVLARAHGRSRRTIAGPDVAVRLSPAGSQPTRVDTIIAVLVLSDKVVQRDELFAAVYGFAYRPTLHEATFKVLRSQAKQHVAHLAEIHSQGGYRAAVLRDFLFRDPRCQKPLGDIMLRFLGHAGRAGAKDLAQQLAVPLRTVQEALRMLVDDGACVVRKDGRRVEYVVEDTTFCEITVA